MKKAFLFLTALFCAGFSFAQIEYTDIEPDIVATPGTEMESNLSVSVGSQSPSEPQFYFQNYTNYGDASYLAVFDDGAGIVVTPSDVFEGGHVTLLSQGAQIGQSSNFSTTMFPVLYDPNVYPDWFGQTGYAGFKVKFGSNVYYGWMRISVNSDNSFTVYEYAVETTAQRAIAAGDNGSSSSIMHVSGNTIALNVYPNPAKDVINLDFAGEVEALQLSDLAGRVLLQQNAVSSTHTLDVRGLEKGVYVLTVATKDGMASRKIVIE